MIFCRSSTPVPSRRDERRGVLVHGHMLVGVWKNRLIARIGPDEAEAALREPHVRVFDITGKAMINWVAVEPEGVVDDDQLNG